MRQPFIPVTLLFVSALSTAVHGQDSVRTHDPAPLLHYETKGAGPPLLLLHPFGGCAGFWGPFDSALATRYQLIIPDLPGHGTSPRPRGAYTNRDAAREIVRLLDSLGLPKVRAIGASAGGMALLHAAVLRPALFDRIIVVSAGIDFPPEARAALRAMTSLDALPPPVRNGWRGCAAGGQEQLDWLFRQFRMLPAHNQGKNLRLTDLRRFQARALIVHGDRDPLFPMRVPFSLQEAITHSALWIVPFGDHIPIIGQERAHFLDEVTAFFAAP